MNGCEDREWSQEWLRSNLTADDVTLDRLQRFVDLLVLENGRQNLLAQSTIPTIWSRHIVDSAQLLLYVPRETSGNWVDLGTGAGLPGIVCALIRPNIQFTLVEQRHIRTNWLKIAVRELSLPNVSIETAKVGNLPDDTFDVISARAFAPLARLLAEAAGLASADTLWLLPKGRSATQELEALAGYKHAFHVKQSVTDVDSGIIVGTVEVKKGQSG